jgi:protein-arginine kinase activator protein McsA
MNANELADYLDKCVVGNENDVYHQAVNMLRKQAEEIEYWKQAFERAMALNDQIKHLETQVYGGTTK